MNNKEKRKFLFKIYSDSFQYIVDNSNLKGKFDKGYGYHCPLCTEHFNKEDLDNKLLTLEHNPPKSLGGKGTILTCKKCNSKAGHSLDTEILNALKEIDAYGFKPNSEFRTKFFNDSTGDHGVNAKLSVDKNGELTIRIDDDINNPRISKKFIENATHKYVNPVFADDIRMAGWHKEVSFKYPIPDPRDEKILQIALLKIAYLIAFEKLGYIFLFSKSIQIVRDQLNNPDKEIIKPPFWIKYDFPDENLGVNIITKPKKLKSLLIVFDLKTKSDKYRFAVVLPGLGSDDDKIYDILPDELTGKGNIDGEINNYINSNYNIKDLDKTFHLVHYWEEIIEKME